MFIKQAEQFFSAPLMIFSLLIGFVGRSRYTAGKHRRGRMISIQEREKAVYLIEEACKTGARQNKACALLGITERTLQRWKNTADQSIGVCQATCSRN